MAKTLLLADDSVTIQKVVNISFASEDVTLVTVDNGDDAVARARETRPDAILADVVMPGKNGYEVCEAIKADPDLAHIPVLLLTGTFESFDEERANRVGAAGHVAKPFEAQTLVSRVKQLLADAPAPAPPPLPSPSDTPPIVPPEAVTSAISDDLGNSDSFDFFDDDLADLEPAAVETPADDAVGFEDTDSAFAFVGDEMAPAASHADEGPAVFEPPPPPDHTIAMVSDEPLGDSDSQDDPLGAPLAEWADELAGPGPFDVASQTPETTAEDLDDPYAPTAPPHLADESFDFSLGDAPADLGPATPDTVLDEGPISVDVGDLAQATVLDPNGASGYDVSSSDLGEPLRDDFEAEAPQPADPMEEFAVVAETTRGAVLAQPADLLAEEDSPAAAIVVPTAVAAPPDPMEAASPIEPLESEGPAPLETAEEPAAAVFEPEFASEFEPLDVSHAADPIEEVRPLPVDAASRTDSVLAEIAPALREQVHDTLEKIAWESFGAVTEKIVSDTVERVEKIAWEVIPQLAEALIKEEIRRLKGEDEG